MPERAGDLGHRGPGARCPGRARRRRWARRPAAAAPKKDIDSEEDGGDALFDVVGTLDAGLPHDGATARAALSFELGDDELDGDQWLTTNLWSAIERDATDPESLERELTAWGQWRSDPINHRRGSARVEPTTVAGERADVLRFLGWLHKRGVQPSVVAVFASAKLGVAVESFVKELVKNGRLYSTCAGYVASCIAAARFSLSVRQRRGETPSTAPIDALVTLHGQCKQQAATQQKYAPKQDGKWLTWEQCQRARVVGGRCNRRAYSRRRTRQ